MNDPYVVNTGRKRMRSEGIRRAFASLNSSSSGHGAAPGTSVRADPGLVRLSAMSHQNRPLRQALSPTQKNILLRINEDAAGASGILPERSSADEFVS